MRPARESSLRSKITAGALRRPWLAALVVALAVAWGVAHAEPCSIKTRGGSKCVVRLPLDQTWAGGLLWGGTALAVVWLALLVVRLRR